MSSWAPLDASNISNPYRMYKDLRKNDPIYKSSSGEWIVSKYGDVKTILGDPGFRVGNKREWIDRGIVYFKDKERDFAAIAKAINTFILLIDPPRHTELRKFIMTAWDNREVSELIQRNIIELLDSNFDKEEVDFVKHFARPLPSMTIAGILGIPYKDCHRLQDWGYSLVKVLDLYNKVEDLVRIEEASSKLINYFSNHLKNLEDADNQGLIKKIVELNRATLALSESEIISICIFLLIAGQETTVGLIGTGLRNLFLHEKQRMIIADDPGRMDVAIEELLRFDGPVHLLGRIARKDMEFRGQMIREGETITLCIASANRDEDQFEKGEVFLIDRDIKRHLAFGSGIHYCLGDWLAKIQGAMAIREIVSRFPNYVVEENSADWNNNLSIRTLNSWYERNNNNWWCCFY